MSDRIELRGLRALGIHGVLEEERARAQPFEIDLDVELDLDVAGRSDRLSDTADYGAVAVAAVRVVETQRCALLEALAERIAEAVLDVEPRVDAVTVAVRKLRPPVSIEMGTAGVRITRTR